MISELLLTLYLGSFGAIVSKWPVTEKLLGIVRIEIWDSRALVEHIRIGYLSLALYCSRSLG